MNHAESTATLQSNARAAALAMVNDAFNSALMRGQRIETDAVGLANDLLKIGVALSEATGHAQLDFPDWQKIAPDLDVRLSFDLAKRALSMVSQYGPTHQFEKFADARPWLQPMLAGLKIIEAPRREPQTSAAANPYLELTADLLKFNERFATNFKDKPISTWPRDVVESFVEEGKVLHDKWEEAAAHLRRS